jgi:hypothetical protein
LKNYIFCPKHVIEGYERLFESRGRAADVLKAGVKMYFGKVR